MRFRVASLSAGLERVRANTDLPERTGEQTVDAFPGGAWQAGLMVVTREEYGQIKKDLEEGEKE